MTSRRTFMSWIGATAATLGFRGRGADTLESDAGMDAAPVPAALNLRLLMALGVTILPAELGDDGVARAVRGFTTWIGAYRPGAEMLHAYGGGKLAQLPALPVERWNGQLRALDAAARASHGVSFIAATREQRDALVRSALAVERVQGMPSPVSAAHVALALLGWYYDSPDATDLCYRARIGKNSCRPLMHNPMEPSAFPVWAGKRQGAD